MLYGDFFSQRIPLFLIQSAVTVSDFLFILPRSYPSSSDERGCCMFVRNCKLGSKFWLVREKVIGEVS